ncbi:MAG: response regulator [Chitinophagaceae bacterium]|nr:response regulator [Oligoflexus sp.]
MNLFMSEHSISSGDMLFFYPALGSLHISSSVFLSFVFCLAACIYLFISKRNQRLHDAALILATRNLYESEQSFSLLVGAVREYAVFMVDPRGIITTWNDGAKRILGYESREIVGRSISILSNPSERQAELCIKDMQQAEIGKHYEVEREPMRADGRIFSARVSLSAIWDKASELKGFSIVVNDITDRKKAENDLKKAKEEAEAASLAKSAFLANMSHEIRTPLGVILGLSDLICSSEVSPEEWEEYTVAIRRNGELLLKIINDILDISKVEAGRLELENIETDIEELVSDVHTLLQIKASEKSLHFTAKCLGDVPSGITMDALRLKQILFNIVGNALKFTHEGFVTLQAHADEEFKILTFEVKDSGPGLTEDQVERLFTPFTQADVSTTRKFGGTGLGLALSRRLANAMGGNLWISETQPGHGTTFTLTLPLTINSEAKKRDPVTWDHTEHAVSLQGLKVLIVDDSPDNLMVVSRMLSKSGANVTTCDGGRNALLLAAEELFDVILMDLQMPELDGYKVTETLRQRGFTKPIFALTAHAFKEERARCLRSGFDGHLIKPVNKDQLVKVLTSMARRMPFPARVRVWRQYQNSHNEYAGPPA